MDIVFSGDYDENNLLLVEVPKEIADYVKAGKELVLKGNQQSILCTESQSYELKYVETSNTLLLLNDNGGKQDECSQFKKEVCLLANHTLESVGYTPRRYSVYNAIKDKCSLTYNDLGKDNIHYFGIRKSIKDWFNESDLCFNEYDHMIDAFHIFEKNQLACVFDENFLFELLYNVLTYICKLGIDYMSFSSDQIFCSDFCQAASKYTCVVPNLSSEEKHQILKYICDFQENALGSLAYSLNIDKVKLLCAKNLFNEKKASYFKLDEFLQLLNSTFVLVFPNEIINRITEENFYYTETNCEDNIFERFNEMDLRFLKGSCIIYFLKTQRAPLIRVLELTSLPETFKERLNALFKYKDKWTLRELKVYLDDLKLGNVEEKLGSLCRVVSEPNPFSLTDQTIIYTQKFKIY